MCALPSRARHTNAAARGHRSQRFPDPALCCLVRSTSAASRCCEALCKVRASRGWLFAFPAPAPRWHCLRHQREGSSQVILNHFSNLFPRWRAVFSREGLRRGGDRAGNRRDEAAPRGCPHSREHWFDAVSRPRGESQCDGGSVLASMAAPIAAHAELRREPHMVTRACTATSRVRCLASPATPDERVGQPNWVHAAPDRGCAGPSLLR